MLNIPVLVFVRVVVKSRTRRSGRGVGRGREAGEVCGGVCRQNCVIGEMLSRFFLCLNEEMVKTQICCMIK